MPDARSMQIARLHDPYMQVGNTGGMDYVGNTGGAIGPGGSDPNDDNGQSWSSRVAGARATGKLPAKDMTGFGAGLGWDDYFDATKLATGGKQTNFVGGASPAGSTQFTGVSTQPTFTTGDSMPGRRPSMAAVQGGGQEPGQLPDATAFNDYLATAPRGQENTREAAAFDKLDAGDTAMYHRDVLQSRQDNDILSGAAGRRQSGIDAIRGRSKMADANAESDAFFSPGQAGMRDTKKRDSMDALRQRYSDPAIIKGQADYDKQILANRGRADVAGITGQAGVAREGVAGRSRIGAAFATQGDNAQAGTYAPDEAPTDAKVFPADRLQEFMQSQGLRSEAEAIDMLKQSGYAVR